MSAHVIIVILLVLLLVGAIPRAGAYSANWGYYPMGGVGLLLLILVVLLLLGVL